LILKLYYGTIFICDFKLGGVIVTIFLTVLFVLVSLALIAIVLLQEGKSAGLSGSISGAAETYWGKNKGRSIEGKLEKGTKFLALAFFILALILNMN
jgi:preprotein translocase subunit SecG